MITGDSLFQPKASESISLEEGTVHPVSSAAVVLFEASLQ